MNDDKIFSQNISQDLNLSIDVALIKNNMKQIENTIIRMDTSVSNIPGIFKALAVQEKILENNEKRISKIEEKMEILHDEGISFRNDLKQKIDDLKETSSTQRDEKHKEILESIEKMTISLQRKIEGQDKRIQHLEKWKYYVLGITALAVLIFSKIPWTILFGGG